MEIYGFNILICCGEDPENSLSFVPPLIYLEQLLYLSATSVSHPSGLNERVQM